MNKQLELLRQLQDIDISLRRIEERRQEAPRRIRQASEIVAQRRQEVEQGTESTKEFQAVIEVQNLELRAQEERCNRLRVQLNTIKTNKEYAAMRHEIAGHEADMSKLEDKILEMMTEIDEQQDRRRKATERLSAAEADLAKAEEETAEELKRYEEEEAGIISKRDEIRGQIEREYLEPYDRLLTRRDGIALVSAENQVCQGCFMNLSPQTRASLLMGEKPVFCTSCGRMLYLDESM